MNRPRISVGMPVYNGSKYVVEAIESVLAQTFGDFELVISDNASTDATEDICRDFAARDARIRYVRNRQNRGAAWNFNRTFELATGDYFKWLAHDDAIGPQYLARTSEVLDQDPALALCHARTGIIDSQGELVGDEDSEDFEAWDLQGISPLVEAKRLKCVSSDQPHRRLLGVLIYSVRCHEVFGLVRASMMRKTRLHRPYASGEKVFVAELSLLGRFHEVSEILSFSRWHDERYSSNTSARAQTLHMNPKSARSTLVPRQVRSTSGYFSSVFHSSLTPLQRSQCLLVLSRFVLQPKKWWGILQGYARGVGQIARLPERGSDPGLGLGRKHWTSLSGIYSKETV
jgi:glycosyltransferase involved in cell wall biosynthesis